MTVTIGINGLGRIGQTVLRIACARPELDLRVGAVNDVAAPDSLAYTLRRDSIRGAFPGTVAVRGDLLVVNGRPIRTFRQAEPARIPWAEAGVDVVIEATGRFRDGGLARAHITHGGARKVVISASATDPDAVLVYGANEDTYDPDRHDVVSPASCGVNALSVLARALLDRFGLHSVATTVVLAAQGWQKVHDSVTGTSRDDPRLGRSASQNLIPHRHVAGDLLTVALPELGRVRHTYFCAPTPIGSLAILAGQLRRPAGVDEVNRALAGAAAGPLAGILAYDPEPTVSSDVAGSGASCLVDPSGTQVTPDGGVMVTGWFDGEWGFSSRLLDLARLVGRETAAAALPAATGGRGSGADR